MPATNTNSSNKYTPTLTSTTGIPLTQYPIVHLRNSPFRQLQGTCCFNFILYLRHLRWSGWI